MYCTVYDYDNKEITLRLPEKKIKEIFVEIITGDETGTFYFEDGSVIYFDAGKGDRIMNFEDGCYSVSGEDIQKWMNWRPSHGLTNSYDRQRIFGDLFLRSYDPDCDEEEEDDEFIDD